MTKRLKYLVAGEWKDTASGVYYEITNSSTGAVMAEAPRQLVRPGPEAGSSSEQLKWDI